MNAVDDFFTNHPFVENAGWRTFSTFFKGSFFRLDDCQFWECRFTQLCCTKGQEFM